MFYEVKNITNQLLVLRPATYNINEAYRTKATFEYDYPDHKYEVIAYDGFINPCGEISC